MLAPPPIDAQDRYKADRRTTQQKNPDLAKICLAGRWPDGFSDNFFH